MSFLLDRVVQVVEVKFDYLDLEAAGGCRYDYVAVYDGPLVNQSRLVGKYCGNQTAQPPVLKSRGSVLALQFRTDYSVAGGGFRAVTRFTYGERAGCGGLVRLGETGSSTITRSTQSRHNHFLHNVQLGLGRGRAVRGGPELPVGGARPAGPGGQTPLHKVQAALVAGLHVPCVQV